MTDHAQPPFHTPQEAPYRWRGVEEHAYKESDGTFLDVTRRVLCRDHDGQGVEVRYFEVGPGGHTTLEKHEHTHIVIPLRGHEAAVGYVESIDATNTFSLDTLECADGWAVAGGILGPKDAPADGPQGAPAALIFEQEGQFWIPKEAADVCGTYTDGTYPADAEVPEALYPAGCLV
jgi:hypothetical protein